MAAITYWVDPVGGSDAADGKSYANRLQTMAQLGTNMTADGNGNDYTINCLNTGDYSTNSTATNVQVFNQTASSFHFRGVSDSSATPAVATVVAGATGTTYWFYIRGATSVIVENFDVDASTDTGGTSTLNFFCTGQNTNNIQIRYCSFRGGDAATGTKSDTTVYPIFNVLGSTTGVTDYFHIHDCYFENTATINMIPTGTISNTATIYNNVIVASGYTADFTAYIPWSVTGGSAGWYFGFWNNTIYLKWLDIVGIGGVIRCTESTDNFNWDFYNNVFFIEDQTTVSSPSIITGAGGTPSSSFTPVTAIGYNIFLISDQCPVGLTPNYYNGALPWDPDITGPPLLYTGDVANDDASAAAYFNDPTATYAWTPDGASVALTCAFDLRLLQETTSGYAGSLPGALPPATSLYTVSVDATKRQYFKPRQNTGVTVTITNTGTDATGVVVSLSAMAADLNYISGNASTGSFTYNDVTKTGSWNIGALSSGGSATLILGYVAPFGVTDDQTFTATLTSSTPGASGASTTTATYSLIPLSSGGGGGGGTGGGGGDPADNPATVPYIDTLPLKQDIYDMDFNVRILTKRNREREHYVRADIEDKQWSEARVLRATIATNTTVDFNLGGIEQGHYLLVESDEPVLVSVNGTAAADFIPQAKAVVLLESYIETLAVKNSSSSTAANVLIAVVD